MRRTWQCAGVFLRGVGMPSTLQHIAMRKRFFARRGRVVQTATHCDALARFFARRGRAVQAVHGAMRWRFFARHGRAFFPATHCNALACFFARRRCAFQVVHGAMRRRFFAAWACRPPCNTLAMRWRFSHSIIVRTNCSCTAAARTVCVLKAQGNLRTIPSGTRLFPLSGVIQVYIPST